MSEAHDDADDLLHQLGAVEREYDERFPHAWEDAVRGARAVDEVAEERREAGDDPDEVEALAQVLGPLGEVEREAWVDRLAALTTTSGGGEGEGGGEGTGGAGEGAAVVSLASRRRVVPWATAGVGLLAAAALAFWMMPRDPVAPVDGGGVSLPSFGLVVRNETVHDVRSGDPDPGTVDRYRADTSVHWVIRPERAAAGALGLRVLAEPGEPGAQRQLLDLAGAVQVSEQGVVEVRGRFGELLPLPPGRWSLRLVVGATPPADLAAFDRGGGWVVVEPPYVIDVVP